MLAKKNTINHQQQIFKGEKKIPESFFRMGEEKVVMCVNTLFFNKLLNLFPQVWHNFAN